MRNLNSLFKEKIFYIFITLYIVLFTISFIHSETGVYWADLSGYQNLWLNFSQLLSSSPLDAISELFRTIRNDDYNELPITLSSPFFFLPIGYRLSYILSLVVLYILPLSILIGLLLNKFNIHNFKGIVFISLTFSTFWIPTLRGYPDISGLIFVVSAILISLNNDLTKKISIKHAILLGLLLWLPFGLRRWYIYTIISLYVSLPVLNYFLYNEKNK